MVILSAFFGWKVSLKMRMLATGWAMILFFGGITLLAGVDTDQWQNRLNQPTVFKSINQL